MKYCAHGTYVTVLVALQWHEPT